LPAATRLRLLPLPATPSQLPPQAQSQLNPPDPPEILFHAGLAYCRDLRRLSHRRGRPVSLLELVLLERCIERHSSALEFEFAPLLLQVLELFYPDDPAAYQPFPHPQRPEHWLGIGHNSHMIELLKKKVGCRRILINRDFSGRLRARVRSRSGPGCPGRWMNRLGKG
jgi:hypothetical protein